MDSTIYLIIALMPLVASMLIFQVNPYHALVIRGILGAIAAMIYGVLGAPDVALTEALVGTLLAITLYAIAVRSSLVMRLGVLEKEEGDRHFSQLLKDLETVFRKHHVRLELVPYTTPQTLQQALMEKEIHATCVPDSFAEPPTATDEKPKPYQTVTRIQRIYDILQTELPSTLTGLSYSPASITPPVDSGVTQL